MPAETSTWGTSNRPGTWATSDKRSPPMTRGHSKTVKLGHLMGGLIFVRCQLPRVTPGTVDVRISDAAQR